MLSEQDDVCPVQVVVSSAFEIAVGLGQYAHLAAALKAAHGEGLQSAPAHGLGTGEWIRADGADATPWSIYQADAFVPLQLEYCVARDSQVWSSLPHCSCHFLSVMCQWLDGRKCGQASFCSL